MLQNYKDGDSIPPMFLNWVECNGGTVQYGLSIDMTPIVGQTNSLMRSIIASEDNNNTEILGQVVIIRWGWGSVLFCHRSSYHVILVMAFIISTLMILVK